MKHIYLRVIALSAFIYLTSLNCISAQVGEALQDELDFKLDSMRNELGVKGLVATLITPSEESWKGASGISSETPLVPISNDMAFGIASITKTLTASVILRYAELSLVNLDDSISQYIEPIQNIDTTITIRQLLSHQSGLSDFVYHPSFNQQIGSNILMLWDQRNVLETFQTPPQANPGSPFFYSNSNYMLLGLIIESISGMEYHEVLRNEMLDPNDLDDFRLFPYESISMSNPAHLWLDITGDQVLDDASAIFTNWQSLYSAMAFAGGYYSTPTQTAQWIKLLCSGALHDESIYSEMVSTVSTNLPQNTRYGLGVMEKSFGDYEGLGHGGDISYSSMAYYIPELDVSLAIHCNDASINSWQLNTTFTELLNTYVDAIQSLGLDETAISQIKVYPNPFMDELSIELNLFENPAEFVLFDLNGKELFRQAISSSGESNRIEITTELSSGMYIYHLYENDRVLKSGKLIKQR